MTYEWITPALVLAVVIFLYRIRTNDLHDLTKTLERIEDKIDRHLYWHLNHRGDDA